MGENTKIQWADHTFNHVRGCTKIAPGCANCYADAQASRNPKTLGIWGPNGTRVVASEAMWREPLKWNREAGQQREAWAEDREERESLTFPGRPARPRVFCASLADVFEDWSGVVVDAKGRPLHDAKAWCQRGEWTGVANTFIGKSVIRLDNVRARLFRLIDATPNLDWLLLTKRPENVRRMWPAYEYHACATGDCPHDTVSECDRNLGFRDNVWLGTSIACQEDADRNVPELLKCRNLCAKTFLSIEPLLGPVMLHYWIDKAGQFHSSQGVDVDWVIVGGESGPNARPCDIAWIRSIVRQCRGAGVPCFVKQIGAQPIGLRFSVDEQGRPFCIEGDCFKGHGLPYDKKGGDPAEWPEDVRVREVPV